MKLKNKKSRNIIGIIQSCLIFALVILVIFMMIQINRPRNGKGNKLRRSGTWSNTA